MPLCPSITYLSQKDMSMWNLMALFLWNTSQGMSEFKSCDCYCGQNDLTILWNDLTWNNLTLKLSDRILFNVDDQIPTSGMMRFQEESHSEMTENSLDGSLIFGRFSTSSRVHSVWLCSTVIVMFYFRLMWWKMSVLKVHFHVMRGSCGSLVSQTVKLKWKKQIMTEQVPSYFWHPLNRVLVRESNNTKETSGGLCDKNQFSPFRTQYVTKK